MPMPTTSPGCTVVGSRTSRVSSTMFGAPKRAGVAAASTKSQRGVMTPTPKETWLGLTRWTRIGIGGSSRVKRAEYTIPPPMRALRLFLVSFLVLFLQVALIRWMPAYVRLLAYFSNFILLAAFLGIGAGCLMTRTRSLFAWYAPLQALVIGVVAWFRLEVAVPTSTSIYFSSGTTAPVVVVESTMLLPLVFVVVAVLFATLAQTMGKLLEGLPPLKGYGVNLAGSIAGVVAFGLMSWFEMPPTAWFAVAFAVAVLLVDAPMGLVGRLAMIACWGDRSWSCTDCRGGPPGRPTTRSRPSRKGRRPSLRSTTSSTSRWPRWRARSTSTSGRTRRSATASRTC